MLATTHTDSGRVDLSKIPRFSENPIKQIPIDLFENCIEAIQDPTMHPIEKASRIWFETVRIHISEEANKRTGKALGSMILHANGYLPPKITEKDADAYVKCLAENFEREDGIVHFTNFIAKMILKTQQEMQPQSLPEG